MGYSSVTPLKRGLLRELGRRLRGFGSTQEAIASRVGLPRPEISAILSQDASRFTIERIVSLLKRCGYDININLTALGKGGLVSWEGLRELGLAQLPVSSDPGLTIIGGADDALRQKVLVAVLREHAYRGERAVLYAQDQLSEDLPTVRFETARDIEKLIQYHSDLDIGQRERFGATVVGLDKISSEAIDSWTALHFAKDMRVYATVESPNGSSEAQRAADAFMSLLGPPHVGGYWKNVKELDAVVVVRECQPLIGDMTTYVATYAKRLGDSPRVNVIVDGEKEHARLASAGLILPVRSSETGLTLRTFDEANSFLRHLVNLFDQEFSVTGPYARSRKELEVQVRDHNSSAEATVAASWSPTRSHYTVVLVTDEPDEFHSAAIPTTALRAAPADAPYLVNRIRAFLRRFSQPPYLLDDALGCS